MNYLDFHEVFGIRNICRGHSIPIPPFQAPEDDRTKYSNV